MEKGLIFSIEEFAVHDGPGIRKTVFFKGCPLRCNWCHNPEGLSFEKEAFSVKDHPVVCGQEYSTVALAAELLKGREILEKSGGGITISGGEPLAQPEFLFELISVLKPIHVAIETSGYAPAEVFRRTIELADLILLDIKHADPVMHQMYTGISNKVILKNLAVLCTSNLPFVIRIPLIPGVNDSENNMAAIASMLMGAQGLERVEFLPYHKTAGAKYEMVRRTYKPIFNVDSVPQVHIEPFNRAGIRSIVL